jgi:hypothetical protein
VFLITILTMLVCVIISSVVYLVLLMFVFVTIAVGLILIWHICAHQTLQESGDGANGAEVATSSAAASAAVPATPAAASAECTAVVPFKEMFQRHASCKVTGSSKQPLTPSTIAPPASDVADAFDAMSVTSVEAAASDARDKATPTAGTAKGKPPTRAKPTKQSQPAMTTLQFFQPAPSTASSSKDGPAASTTAEPEDLEMAAAHVAALATHDAQQTLLSSLSPGLPALCVTAMLMPAGYSPPAATCLRSAISCSCNHLQSWSVHCVFFASFIFYYYYYYCYYYYYYYYHYQQQQQQQQQP